MSSFSLSSFLSFKPSLTESTTISIIKEIEAEASSFEGITKSIPFGSEFVSTIPNIGIFNFFASFTAIDSLNTSTIKIAAGILVISAILPRLISNFSLCLEICNLSLLEIFLKVPSTAILSIEFIFLIAFLTVGKLVNIPPDHRSVIYGIPTVFTFSETISLACFFVATKRIFLPDFAICFNASAASSNFTIVLCKSII